MLDLDRLNATDSGAVGPADQIVQAMEKTCKWSTGHGLYSLAQSVNPTEPRYHLLFRLDTYLSTSAGIFLCRPDTDDRIIFSDPTLTQSDRVIFSDPSHTLYSADTFNQ